MNPRFLLIPLAALFLSALTLPAQADGDANAVRSDEKILAARDAFRKGDRAKLGKLLETVRGHDLEPWVEYWQLRQTLEDDNGGHTKAETPLSSQLTARLENYFKRYAGSYTTEKLRGDWLKVLGKRHLWETFQREYPQLVQPDQEINCYSLQARHLAQRDSTALVEARQIWFSTLDLPDSCVPLMEAMIVNGSITASDVWQRMRHLLEAKKLGVAKQTAEYLPLNQMPDAKTLSSIADKPDRYLDKLPADFKGDSRLNREMALYAVQRLARSDPSAAAAHWQKIKDKFPASDRGYAWGQLALAAAQRHMPDTLAWYEEAARQASEPPEKSAASETTLSDEQLAWKTRAALRAQDWATVKRTIGLMPPRMAAQPDWTYWLARAQAALGHQDEAQALYRRIYGQPNFYGTLALEELGLSVKLPAKAASLTKEDIATANQNSGLRRALALIRLDLRIEGVREWAWTLRGMEDRQLLAAAEMARRAQVFDRAINAADKTQVEHDYSMRYLTPFREYVVPRTKQMSLDSEWVYGLMRQESRFVMNAKSSVGAQGLMQLMPKTARWVAKKIGLKSYHPAKVAEMDTNIELGTNYLRMVLAGLDNHPVLASAAYNAGPGRARRWCAEKPLEGAIYAETIPFNETRDYVKKVMNNTVYYAALMESKPQSLKSRLGVVGSRKVIDVSRVEDLP